MLFTGKSEHSIDAKQRLAIPAKVRAGLDPKRDGKAFYIVQGANGGLWLWPERTFERMASAESMATLTPAAEDMELDEINFPEAERLEIDSAGRIRLPQDKLAAAGIGSRALILGMRHHLELWDPARWAARNEDRSTRAEITERARIGPPVPRRPGGEEHH